MSHKIIAISREYGSGGLEIATKLAERMGVPIYNKNITDLAAEKSGISKAILREWMSSLRIVSCIRSR
jgi:cytidylate kinase